ncbi:MAG: hypothetical protein AAGF71_04285 [Pseudomonadota bacterium]
MTTQVTFDQIMAAAKRMERVYENPDHEKVVERIENRGVQAYFYEDKTLVIPGTNEKLDWIDFNLEAFNFIGKDPQIFATKMGDSGAFEWHAGFLEHAHTVFTFANILKPKMIIGHSLGAASAQIVGSSMRVPTLAFASPRTLRAKRSAARPSGSNFVLNMLRTDDLVCDVPPRWLGFTHVGQVVRMNPKGIHWGEDHQMEHYIEAMTDEAVKPKLDNILPLTLSAQEPMMA